MRKLISLRGPAYKTRKCNNTKDFMTLETLNNLSHTQFYSYKDKDGFIYGVVSSFKQKIDRPKKEKE